jgi:UDP-2,4-diacetamido-2,4,6-trideoxy-beta-L-altropyranose hydrolase
VGGGARGPVVTQRALLAADCGSGVGLGHLERILALADALIPEMDVCILLPQGNASLQDRVAGRGHLSIDAPGSTAERVDAAVAGSASFDVVVLDGYVFDVDLQRRLRDRAALTLIDDLRLPTDCDLAVNPSPGGETLWPAGAVAFLGGAAYAPIRRLFVDARDRALRDGRDPRTVLVSTGATDLGGIGRQVSLELLEHDRSVEVVRVVGPDALAGSLEVRPRERLLVAPPDLAGALATATVYVGAAGTTAVQAACVGTPAVVTAAVANQTAQAAALAAAGCAVASDPSDLLAVCLRLLDDPTRRWAMSASGRTLVDGLGATRVADAVRHLVTARAA